MFVTVFIVSVTVWTVSDRSLTVQGQEGNGNNFGIYCQSSTIMYVVCTH